MSESDSMDTPKRDTPAGPGAGSRAVNDGVPGEEPWLDAGNGGGSTAHPGERVGALIRDVLEAVILAVVLFVLLQFAVQNTVVDGASMEPNFVNRQRLLVNKLAYRFSEPARGDVIVFHPPDQGGKDFIKRIVALPGETITVVNGQIRIDGADLTEPWQPVRGVDAFGPYAVPDGQYFVMGDNRPYSNDSRSWNAALPRERIVGKVWISVWPQEAWGLVRTDRPGPAYADAAR